MIGSCLVVRVFFFFVKQKTAYEMRISDWSSDVCSSDLTPVFSLRGVGFFETSIGARPTVSVYTDEVPLPFSVMAQGAAFDLEREIGRASCRERVCQYV